VAGSAVGVEDLLTSTDVPSQCRGGGNYGTNTDGGGTLGDLWINRKKKSV
jgi:hypothetical protein